MTRIMIVDDQANIREGLRAMLGQFAIPVDELYSAATGLEAMELLRCHPIELVITDIRMPDMDGLELMAAAREESFEADFLILSGYGEFSYAQRAIELGAKGYLLKPVKREDLQTAIEHALQDANTRQELSRDLRQLSERSLENDRKEMAMFMNGAAYDEAWIDRMERQNPSLWRHYRVCLLREDRRIHQPGASGLHGMEAIAYGVYGRQGYVCLQMSPHLVLAVSADVGSEALTSALQSAQIDASLAVTDSQQGLRGLPDLHVQLMELYRHGYLFPELRCLRPADIAELEAQWELPYEQLYALFQQLGTPGSGRIAEELSALFHKRTLQRFRVRYTEQLCRAAAELLEEYELVIRPYMGEEELDVASLRNLYDYPGIREYLQALQRQLLRLNQYYIDFKCSYRNTQDLNEAIRFIHENYHKPLDLAMVSNHVSLNYAYFSNLFKKNVGKGFAEYLRDVRLDKARRLLAETDHKIVDVTEMVGYENYKSFTRAFREATGLQPTEYRERMRRRAVPYSE